MRVVSPYRPFAPESIEHQTLGAFDWVDALRMLGESVTRSNGCETVAITDVDTVLPVPALQFETTERRLMLWILEVSLRYLDSDAFDQDTVLISPDMLVFGPLDGYLVADLGIVVRMLPKYRESERQLLNSVQFWAHRAKPRLIAFYQDVLALAKQLPENVIVWGADTEPLKQLLSPFEAGMQTRAGMAVCMWPAVLVLEAPSKDVIQLLTEGYAPRPPEAAIVEFRYLRKRAMRAYFDATLGAVPA